MSESVGTETEQIFVDNKTVGQRTQKEQTFMSNTISVCMDNNTIIGLVLINANLRG